LVTATDAILDTPAAALTASALTLSPIDAASVFGDALALFAHESTQALLPAEIAATVEHKLARPRAWAITLAVLATDAVLLGRWMARRSRPRRAAGNPFALAQITTEPDIDDDDF
jgi:hypothetical protein